MMYYGPVYVNVLYTHVHKSLVLCAVIQFLNTKKMFKELPVLLE